MDFVMMFRAAGREKYKASGPEALAADRGSEE